MDDPLALGGARPASTPSSTPATWANVDPPTYGRSDPRGTYSIAMYAGPVDLEEVQDGDDVRVRERAREP